MGAQRRGSDARAPNTPIRTPVGTAVRTDILHFPVTYQDQKLHNAPAQPAVFGKQEQSAKSANQVP